MRLFNQLLLPFRRKPAVPPELELPPEPEPVRVDLGDISVDIKATYCCGFLVWYGLFPDRSVCCTYGVHGSFEEALGCARQRVAAGFVVRRADEK